VKEHFVTNILIFFTVAEVPKMAERRYFQNVGAITIKKSDTPETVRVTDILHENQNVKMNFCSWWTRLTPTAVSTMLTSSLRRIFWAFYSCWNPKRDGV